jgi:hypothetical protein
MTVKKYTKKEKMAALKRLKAGESASAISREMNIPRTTLLSWQKSDVATGASARKKTTQAREKTSTHSTGGQDERNGKEKSADSKRESKEELYDGENNTATECENGADEQAADLKYLNEKKKNFSKDSWGNIEKAQKIIERRLERALYQEDAMDELVNAVLETSDKDLTYQEKQSLLNKLRKIKVEDVRELVMAIGTLYDKQALANKDATSIVDGRALVRFEDL